MKTTTEVKQMDQLSVVTNLKASGISNNEKSFRTISEMWGKFFQSYKGEGAIVATYTNYESDQTGAYDFYIGTVQENVQDPILVLPTGKYLVIEINVDSPESLQSAVANAWQNVWCNTDLKRTFVADYELYTSPKSVAICVGVE